MRLLLLAGGGGTRLWPLSTEDRPKQFLPLLSSKSLLRETYERVLPVSADLFVATSARHAALVRAELPEVPGDRILTEPVRRNSGPAILAAALRFSADGDPVTAAIPSDQTVRDGDAFRRALREAESLADAASVVLLLAVPTRVEPDYGYVEHRAGRVTGFTEKPDRERARELAGSGRHFWNAGIFVFRPSRLLAEARRVAGDLVEGASRWVESGSAADYERLPDISIDFAVMEKISGIRAIPLDAGWSDVGTWRSVRDLRREKDPNGNLVISPVPVLAPGLKDAAVVVGASGVLVLPFEREGELRDAVNGLRPAEASSAPREEPRPA
ncbi:MAG: mannose-1-phosphate guanylyltransferase [Syntrophomonadaceae bacterium]